MKAPAFWSARPGLMAWSLSPFAWVYGQVTAWRMARRGTASTIPVICIGNFTAGGAGKTPVVAFLAGALAKAGEVPFVVSRGYRGRMTEPTLVNPATMTAADCGDEPLLLARFAPTIVSADRVAGAALAQAQGATLILLDDGLQSPGLRKDFSLAVVDAIAGFGNGLCIPSGPLRAPVDRQLSYVDAILLMGGNKVLDDPRLAAIRASGKPMLHGTLRADIATIDRLASRPVLAFAGIGRPTKFFDTLRSNGVTVADTMSFADHHPYSAADLASLRQQAEAQGLTLVTTEKDAMRLPAETPDIAVLPVSLELDDASLLQMIRRAIDRRRSEP